MSRFSRKRLLVVAGGALLTSALVVLGVHTAVTSGGGNGLVQGRWALVSAVPTSSRVEILAVEGGCHRFDHLDVSYRHQTIAITTWDHAAQGACPANLSFEQHTVPLPGLIGARQIAGACLAIDDALCAEAQQFASRSSSPPASS